MSQTTFTTTATATYAVGNTVAVTSTANMFSGLPIVFTGTTFGGITAGATYYIGDIVVGYPSSNITLTTLPGGSTYGVDNGTGNMTATFNQGGQQIIPTVAPGEPLNQAFTAVNVNFDQLWAAGPVDSNIQITDNSILTTNTNGNINLVPNGIGNVVSSGHILPNSTRIRNLGSPSQKWLNIYAQYLTVDNASLGNIGNITIDVANLHISGGSNGYVLQTDGAGNLTWTAQTGGMGNGVPGGTNTQVQYNDAGAFGGTAGFTFDNTSNTLSAVKINTTDVFNSNGIVLENSDLTQGATAAVVIPTNGSSDPIQVNNTYGNIALQTGAGSGITASWLFNSDGSLSLPAGNLVGLGNVIGPGNISYTFGPGPVLLANTAGNNSAYFSLTAVANATGVLGYMGMAQFGSNTSTGLVETNDDTGDTHDWYFNPDGTTVFPAYTFPNVDGTSGQVLTTYGNALLYWANAGSGGGANTGNVTFNDINIIGTGNLHLQPDPANAAAYLDVYLTTGPDIHIAGNNESVILGRDTTANVTVNTNGNVTIQSWNGTPNIWSFDTAGNLSIPGGGAVWTLGTAGTAGITANILDPFAVNLGLDYSGNSATLAAGNLVTIQTATGAKSWIFDSAGELTLPSGGRLGFAGKGWTGLDGGNGNAVSLTSFYANGFYAGCVTNNTDGNINLSTYTGNGLQGNWTFDNTGNLTASGNISAVGNVVGGNITGSYLFGNGSQLTGVGAASVPSQNILPTIQSIIIANTSSEYETSGGSGYANVLVANVAPVIEYGVIVTAGSTVDKYVTGNLANIPGTEKITISTGTSDQPFTVYAYVTTNAGTYYSGPEVGFSGLCLLKGTMISLADGTYKPIEDINNGDLLLTWNFDLGQYAQARPLWIKRGESGTRYNKLTFSDGTTLRTFDQHRIFNKQAGAFTYPMSDDTPIGTVTVNEHGQEITLVKREIVWDTIEHYNIITDHHINLFADSILTSCRFNNIYPITDMKFVKDVVVNRNLSEFAEIESRFVSGLRLQEQSFELAMITGYVNRLLATEVTESISI